MAKTVEGRSAGQRSRPSEVVARSTDAFEIALAASEIQTARILACIAFGSALPATMTDLAFGQADGRCA